MEKEKGKTLCVFVSESIKVSDKYKENRTQFEKAVKPVFAVFVCSVMDFLFEGIQNFARPPTSQFNFTNFKNIHLAI